MKQYSKFLDYVDKVIAAIIGTLLAVMAILMVYQVVLRYCFHSANSWSEELIRYLFIWVIMLGGCLAIRRNSHLKVDMFIGLFRPKIQAVIHLLTYVAILVFLTVLFVLGLRLVAQTTNNLSAGIRIPMAVPYTSIPLGAFLMILTTIEYLLGQVKALKEIGKGENS